MIYSYITQSQFLTQLASRLYDPLEQQWTHAEKTFYLQDALRTFNALTATWRGDFTGNTSLNTAFYDLTSTATFPDTLRPLTLLDTDLYLPMQYHLLEPPSGVNPWSGVSSQFSADDLIQAVARRRDELLSISGCTITRRLLPVAPGRTQLPDGVIDVRRVAYIANPASLPLRASPMFPDDTWSLQAFNRGYTTATPGTPSIWMLNTQPPLAFDVDRQPSSGNYDILTVDAGLALSPQIPNPLSVPDDWTHVIKWGALGDLLSREANAADPMRAAYCNQRFIMGAGLLIDAPALLAARIANVPVQIDAMRNADMYTASWQNLPAGVPASILQSGLNMIAVSPPPDTGPYSMTFTVIENAPIPANDAAQVQLARDDLDAVLGYCVHISLFKSGGREFTDTMPLLDNFIKAAARYNSKLREWGEFTKILQGVSQMEERFTPRMEPEVQQQ
jgi:hypothetical protein